tara:strand:+ start:72 stop:248 length:177 start_codon:yes stop_codon:yes gene_type:complete
LVVIKRKLGQIYFGDIAQRGHNRQPVFVERRDFEYYLANLQEWKQVYELEAFSYCLIG